MYCHRGNTKEIKLIDFGLSQVFTKDHPVMSAKIGTPYYVCPEIIKGAYDKGCDMWSIGVLTYIMLSGYPPFNANNETDLFDQILDGNYDFPAEDWEGISYNAKDFIFNLLQVDP
mmetsp:Transcript_7747/g.7201  ORF Transcript_7747/g.7201 Transcript_7747/m.7201 type:complete len:115 (+) Transcript_7747:743-1087(+)